MHRGCSRQRRVPGRRRRPKFSSVSFMTKISTKYHNVNLPICMLPWQLLVLCPVFLISTSSALYYSCAALPIPPPTDKTNVSSSLWPIDGNALNLLSPPFFLFIQRKYRTNNNKLNTVWILVSLITELSFNVRQSRVLAVSHLNT